MRQACTGSDINEWLRSAGSKSPT